MSTFFLGLVTLLALFGDKIFAFFSGLGGGTTGT